MFRIDRRLLLLVIMFARPSLARSQVSGPAGIATRRFDSAFLIFSKIKVGKKDEFETEEAFTRRAKANIDTSLIAIAIADVGDGATATISYNAEAREMRINLSGELITGPDEATLYGGICLRNVERKTGTHMASNAFGVRRLVTDRKSDRQIVAAAMGNPDWAIGPSITFPLEPDSARVIKPTMRVFVVGRPAIGPAGSVTTEADRTGGASISVPISLRVSRKILWMNPLELWVVDGRNGTVLAKKTP
jgi:hypothetical protein